jgi:Lon protease-like protein
MSTTSLELPLFPLNAVLFPGTVIPLHIVEPRYRQMIADCLREEKPFGIVLVRLESEHLREIPYSVGTIAEIRNLDRLKDGRYALMAVGSKRFRILSHHRQKPYLSGLVEILEDEAEPEEELLAAMKQARHLFNTYLDVLLESAADEDDIQTTLPDNPEELSHFIAYFLEIPNEQRQYFLEMTSTLKRLREETAILRREVPFMRQMLTKVIPSERAILN